MRLSIHASFGAARVGDDPRRDLVVDRPEMAGVLLDEEAVADQRHGRSFRLVAELDGEGIHGDGADHAPPRPRDEHLGPRQSSAEAVSVADPDEPDTRLTLGAQAPP